MSKRKKLGKKLKEFSVDTRMKSANVFRDRVLQLFKNYVKSIIVWGSITRGDLTGKSDVDTYIIFDDTKMPLKKFDEIRDKVDNDLYKIAKDTDPRLHVQPVIALTEFMDGIRLCHPLFFNIIREGYAVYDTGFFIPMRKLLEWGKFPATPEAAELRMEGVPKRIMRVKNIKPMMIAEDLWYATIDAGQAVLMYIGVGPPAPKVLARELRRHLVDTNLLEEKYAQFAQDIHEFRKKVEHKEVGDLPGKDLDDWIERCEDYVNRMERLLKDLEMKRKETDIQRNYEVMIKASVAALKAMKKLPPDPKDLSSAFRKYIIEPGLVTATYSEVFNTVIEMKKKLEEKSAAEIPDRDVFMSKEYVRRFVMDMRNIIEGKIKLPPAAEQEANLPAQIGQKLVELEEKAEEKMEKAREELDTAVAEKVVPPPIGKIKKHVEEIEEKILEERKKHKKQKK